jgi:hypothetical protein
MLETENKEYNDFVSGKKVAIVAHATSIVGTGMGSTIDSYDLVIRLNDSLPIPEELKPDIGTRCDILYSWFPRHTSGGNKSTITLDFLKDMISWVCCPHPLEVVSGISETAEKNSILVGCGAIKTNYNAFLSHQHELNSTLLSRITDPYKYFERLGEMNSGMPNTGFATVWDLLNFDVIEIFMAGFTFMLGGNYKQYWAAPFTEKQILKQPTFSYTSGVKHCIYPQLRYLKILMERDSRIKVDAVLKEILETRI